MEENNSNPTETNTGLRKRLVHNGESSQDKDASSPSERATNSSLFDCHICFDSPNDPVVTPCGHLYCWSCIYKWMVSHPDCPSCPLCKSSLEKDKIIPIYGRNGQEEVDPRTKVIPDIPARPSGQRTEPPRSSQSSGGTFQSPHSPFYGNPFYPGPFSSPVHHSNFGPFSVSAFGPFPSLFGLQFTYPPPQSSGSVSETMTEEQANQAFVSRLLLVMGLLIILCLLFV
ncbi:hypothetical protein GpartN1_g6859.t1 [Galdieria partita]|uniref:RING-type E3 ubiquitin transferase n=1 Tax=Galdieria partita TaxID=83374 RepID=A0A9C7UTP2_9RHOD|nr:hypothetical protein GpartN1_g6859.t1 [Galdieria partita]